MNPIAIASPNNISLARLNSEAVEARTTRTHSQQIILLGFILISLQILDGVFTGIGVNEFGTTAEGNPLIYGLMQIFGPHEALILCKGLSIAIICMLCGLAYRLRWLIQALRFVAGIYLGAAIIPWSIILSSRFFFS